MAAGKVKLFAVLVLVMSFVTLGAGLLAHEALQMDQQADQPKLTVQAPDRAEQSLVGTEQVPGPGASDEKSQNPAIRRADRKVEPAGDPQVSAPGLMQTVYDSLAWVDAARTLRIRTQYTITHTDAERRWADKQPRRGPFGGGGKLDPRPSCLNAEWAWDESRIHYRTQTYYQGEPTSTSQTRIWNGSLAVEYGASAEGKHTHYVLGNKPEQFFERMVTGMAQLPWGMGGAHHLWWSPTDVAKYRESRCISPEDFELVGQDDVQGRRCYVIQSRVAHYRMHIGVADQRLYRRTWLLVPKNAPGYDHLALCQKIGGKSIKTGYHWQAWLESLDPVARRQAGCELNVAEFAFARPRFHHTFDDYRQAAPGCWLPFRQTIDNYNLDVPEPFLASQSVQTVTEVAVNQPLADELFRIELTEGVPVATDWRYDPIIRYTYRKDQTEAERVALSDAARKEQAEVAQELENRRAVIKSRVGSPPLALPQSGWINGGPLSWEQLRGKVVVLHFWDVNCGPCQNDLPFLARWHEDSTTSGVVIIGVHPPTTDLAAVRKKLAEFDAKYPVLIDAPATKPGGLGLLHDWFGNSWWPHTVLVNKRGLVAGHGQLWMGDISAQMRQLGAEKD